MWEELEVDSKVIASVRYEDRELSVYQKGSDFYYFSPLCELLHKKAEGGYNKVTGRWEVRFPVLLFSPQLKEHVWRYLKSEGKDIGQHQIRGIPFEAVRMKCTQPMPNCRLIEAWSVYNAADSVSFTLLCDDEDAAKKLEKRMQQEPEKFYGLQLQFKITSKSSESREISIHLETIVQGNLFAKLLQRYPEAKSVLLTADDAQALLAESRNRIQMAVTYDAEMEPPSESYLSDLVEKFIFSEDRTLSTASDKMWDSVFWDMDNCRPDKVCKSLNDTYGKLDAEEKCKWKADFKAAGITKWIASLDLKGEYESLKKMAGKSKNHIEWDGQKFIPKTMDLRRVNLSSFRGERNFQDIKTKVSRRKIELSAPLFIRGNPIRDPFDFHEVDRQLRNLRDALVRHSRDAPAGTIDFIELERRLATLSSTIEECRRVGLSFLYLSQ